MLHSSCLKRFLSINSKKYLYYHCCYLIHAENFDEAPAMIEMYVDDTYKLTIIPNGVGVIKDLLFVEGSVLKFVFSP